MLTIIVVSALMLKTARGRASLQQMLAPVSALLPETARERWAYAGVALTAGICEELLYRSFLIYYLTARGLTQPAAIVGAGIVFGLGHIYQGGRGAVQAGAAGIAFGAVYWLGGSVIPVMVIHALADLRVFWLWHPEVEVQAV